MKIGIAAATSFEIKPTIELLPHLNSRQSDNEFKVIITGIGSVAATYQLTRYIRTNSPAFMIQAGIGGAFSNRHAVGETFIIEDELMADLGVEENNLFNDLFDMGFMQAEEKPFANRRLVNPQVTEWTSSGLAMAHGSTVNEISTRPERIRLLTEKYGSDIESMEGAAFHYVCLQENVPFLQLRSVSNYTGERDKSKWNIPAAISNLNDALIKILQQIP